MKNRSLPFSRGTIMKAIAILMLISLILPANLSSSLASAGLTPALYWNKECVDCPKFINDLTERSLQMDASGHPQIAYGGDHLYRTWHDGISWQMETVDPIAGVILSPSLAFDASENPIISYFDSTHHTLNYAFQQAGAWQTTTIANNFIQDEEISLAAGSDGKPQIVYSKHAVFNDYQSKLNYAYLDAGSWVTETIDAEGNVGWEGLSMAVDTGGYPHVLYHHRSSSSEGNLRYIYKDASEWHILDLNSVTGAATKASLTLDQQGYPHISYIDSGSLGLVYAYQDAIQWHTESVEAGMPFDFIGLTIRLSTAGDPFISYITDLRSSGFGVKLAVKGASGWQIQPISSGSRSILSTSLVIDNNNKAYLSYHDGGDINTPGNYQLRYAHQSTDGWQVDAIDQAGSVGHYLALKLDGSDRARISYYDLKNQNLKYAFQDASGWQTEIVDSGEGVGKYPSMDLDQNGYAHISYYDEKNGRIWYAYQDGSGWHLLDLSSVDWTNWYRTYGRSALKVNQGGYPYIVGQSYFLNYLQLLYQDTSGWHNDFIDNTGTANYVSIALDANGYPHIGYANNGLKYAYKDDTGWHKETVDASPSAGYFNSIAIDQNGYPRISYFDFFFALKFAYKDSAGWHTETVTTVESASASSKLLLDQNDFAYISFGDTGEGTVSIAYQDATGWHFSVVDHLNAGTGNAIALDSESQPVIAFATMNDHWLMLATPGVVPPNQKIFVPIVFR